MTARLPTDRSASWTRMTSIARPGGSQSMIPPLRPPDELACARGLARPVGEDGP